MLNIIRLLSYCLTIDWSYGRLFGTKTKTYGIYPSDVIVNYDSTIPSKLTSWESIEKWNEIEFIHYKLWDKFHTKKFHIDLVDVTKMIGVLQDSLDKGGIARYTVDVIPDALGSGQTIAYASRLEMYVNKNYNELRVKMIQGEKSVHCYQNMQRPWKKVKKFLGIKHVVGEGVETWQEDVGCSLKSLEPLFISMWDDITDEWDKVFIQSAENINSNGKQNLIWQCVGAFLFLYFVARIAKR